MLENGAELLFELEAEAGRAGERSRCVVVQGGEALVRVAFVEGPRDLRVGQRGRAFFETARGFVSRVLHVREVSPDGSECLIGFHGEAQPAPAREFYRVDVADRDLWCTLADERCRITTLSPGGLGVISRRRHAQGQNLELVFYDRLESVRGRVRVANRSVRDDGWILYGLRLATGVLETRSELGDALSRQCAALQLESRRKGAQGRGD